MSGIEENPEQGKSTEPHPYSHEALDKRRQQRNSGLETSFMPSAKQAIATQLHVLLGLYATPGQIMDIDPLYKNYEAGINPSRLDITLAFGLLLQGLVADGLLESVLDKNRKKPFVGYRLTKKAISKLEHVLNSHHVTDEAIDKLGKEMNHQEVRQTPQEREKRRREIADFKAEGAPASFLAKYITLSDEETRQLITEGWKFTSDIDHEIPGKEERQIHDLLQKMRKFNPLIEDVYAEGKQIREKDQEDLTKSVPIKAEEQVRNTSKNS